MIQRADAIPTYILRPDGLRPAPFTVHSLAEAVAYEPPGVYTVARTFRRCCTLLLDAHLDRLEESARLSGISLHLDRERLRAALRELIDMAGYVDSKFRITVPQDDSAALYLSLEPLQAIPEALYKHGVKVITVPIRRTNPVVKTTRWMQRRRSTYDTLPEGVYEGIMIDARGCLLEGLSSNFYGVLDSALHTARDGVLAGITRKAVFEIAPEVLPLVPTPVCQDNIPRLTEAMLTSSSRGVLPVTSIDGQLVGDGKVGPIISEICRRYDAWAEAHMEPL